MNDDGNNSNRNSNDYQLMSITACAVINDHTGITKETSNNTTVFTKDLVYSDNLDIEYLLSSLGDNDINLVTSLFAFCSPEYFCCECHGEIFMCDNCLKRSDYMEQFNSFKEILLAYYMYHKYKKIWDSKRAIWKTIEKAYL